MQTDTLVSTCPLLKTSLVRYERIVDVKRSVQKTGLTKLYYQQTDGTEKHKKDKTNTMSKITDGEICFFLRRRVEKT